LKVSLNVSLVVKKGQRRRAANAGNRLSNVV
jgi:hypothetical protein